jgi:iron complex outermembrane receptor protein
MRPLPRQHLLNAALAAAFGSVLTVWAPVASAQASGQAAAQVFDVQVPSQALGAALNEFSRQTGVQVFAAGDVVAGTSSRAVAGKLTLEQALRQMLAGSSLEATRTANGGFAVRRAADVSGAQNTLPAVQVVANADESPTGAFPGYVARRSATATKTDTPVLEVPQSISVIGREEMDARGAQDVMEAIRYTPGVTTGMYGPDNRGWEYILLRGFPTTYSVFRDGLAQPLFGPTYYLTEPYGLERVEVLRGPSSMVFGQGDAGGIVNRVSKQANGERSARSRRSTAASSASNWPSTSATDRQQHRPELSRWSAWALDSNDQDRYPDGRKLNHTRSYIAPSVRWQPNATTSLTVFGEFLRNNTGEDPYYLTQDYKLTRSRWATTASASIKQTPERRGLPLRDRARQ